MQQQKSCTLYYRQYAITITPKTATNTLITVIDLVTQTLYQQSHLELNKIKITTLIEALKQTKQELAIQISTSQQLRQLQEEQKQSSYSQYLIITVNICSKYFIPISQTLKINKKSQLSQQQTIKYTIQKFAAKVQQYSINQKPNIYYTSTQIKSYTSDDYENIASITLPTGKYLLTLSFLLQACNPQSWIYLSSNKNAGGQLFPNQGFYTMSSSNFVPNIIRTVYNITEKQQTISFRTYSQSYYNVTLKNTILSAETIK